MDSVVDAQELRRRWSDKTNAVFGARDRYDYQEYPAVKYEREFDFERCRNIVFMRGERTGTDEDVILLTQGTGHMTLPADVQVLVHSGYAKWAPAVSASANGGAATVIGTGTGTASAGPASPAASPVSNYYSPSSVDSGYSGSGWSRATPRSFGQPADAASFGRGPARASGDWEVVDQMSGYGASFRDDDGRSIAPSESISSVNSRGAASNFPRRYTQPY